MEKKRNLWVIPTDKPSRLKSNKNVFDYSPAMMFIQEKDWKNQNIYITSDEEIKEGDWCYFKEDNLITKTKTKLYVMLANSFKTDKKIILTTDQDLIKDGVQAIPDEFLEWFVKNPSCESVEVEIESKFDRVDGHYHDVWEIIIPKEEPKQETFEEFVFKVPFNYNIKPKEVIDMCMKEQENIILTWRLGHFIDMINSLPDDTEKNRILKSVFDNRDGELLLESYKSMKKHYEK